MSTSDNEFPQERVVQGRQDAPTQSGSVQGTPDILEELRARASEEIEKAGAFVKSCDRKLDGRIIDITIGQATAFADVIKWLDELAQPNEDTARDTKSSIAGVP